MPRPPASSWAAIVREGAWRGEHAATEGEDVGRRRTGRRARRTPCERGDGPDGPEQVLGLAHLDHHGGGDQVLVSRGHRPPHVALSGGEEAEGRGLGRAARRRGGPIERCRKAVEHLHPQVERWKHPTVPVPPALVGPGDGPDPAPFERGCRALPTAASGPALRAAPSGLPAAAGRDSGPASAPAGGVLRLDSDLGSFDLGPAGLPARAGAKPPPYRQRAKRSPGVCSPWTAHPGPNLGPRKRAQARSVDRPSARGLSTSETTTGPPGGASKLSTTPSHSRVKEPARVAASQWPLSRGRLRGICGILPGGRPGVKGSVSPYPGRLRTLRSPWRRVTPRWANHP